MTPQQARLLQFLQERAQESAVCPSYREMAAALGLGPKSVSCVHLLVCKLERSGHVTRVPGAKRALRVVLPSSGPLGVDEVAWCHAHADAVRALRARLDARLDARLAAE